MRKILLIVWLFLLVGLAHAGLNPVLQNYFTTNQNPVATVITNQILGAGLGFYGGVTNIPVGNPSSPTLFNLSGTIIGNGTPMIPGTYTNLSANMFTGGGTNCFLALMTNAPGGAKALAGTMTNDIGGGIINSSYNLSGAAVIVSNTLGYIQISNNSSGSVIVGSLNWTAGMQVPTSISSIVVSQTNTTSITNFPGAVTNLTYTATIYSNNIVYLNGQWTNYPSSTTAGIQETWNAIANTLNLAGTNGLMGGAVINFAAATFPYTTQIYIDSTNPVDIQLIGMGIDGTKLVYTGSGTYLNGYFHVGGAPNPLVFRPIDLTVRNICFSAITQQTNTIVYVGQTNTPGDLSYIKFADCDFESWQVVTNNAYGPAISKFFSLGPLNLQVPGLVGLQLNTSEEHADILDDCYFSGLACGAFLLCDHLYMTTANKAAYCGVSGTTIVRNTLWSSNFIYSTASPFIFENSTFQGEIDNMHIWNCAVGPALFGPSIDRFVNLFLEQNSPSPVQVIADSSTVKATFIDSYGLQGALTNAVYYMSPIGVYTGNYAITNIQNTSVVFENSGLASGNVLQIQQGGYNFEMTPNNGGIEGNGFTFFPNQFALNSIGSGNIYPYVTITGSISNNATYGGPVNGGYGYSYYWTLAFPGQLVLTNPASKMCIVSNDTQLGGLWVLEPTNQINQGNSSQPIYTGPGADQTWPSLVGAWATAETGSTDNGVKGTFVLAVSPLNYMSQSGFFGNGSGLTNITTNCLSASGSTAGQVLTSTGSSTPPVFSSAIGTIVNTNWIIGGKYNLAFPVLVNAKACLTVAGIVGSVDLDLEIAGNTTNSSGTSTAIASIPMNYTNVISGYVPANTTFDFTNRSSGAGNSATVGGGQYIIQ
jgi:hypothetical protein